MHIDSPDYKAARVGVAVSATPIGPFQYLGSLRPNAGVWPLNANEKEKVTGPDNPLARDFNDGQMARDLTVFVDDDEKGYLFYASEENLTMHVSALTDDYLHTAAKYARIFVGRSMEAPAVFKHGGKYYLIASDCTGWAPNAARLAVADSVFGPWKELGNPCVGKDAEFTFQAQSAFVLPVAQSKDQFIFMADRWNQWDLADSRQVWLPIQFENERPSLRWRDHWSLPDLHNQLQAQRTALKETSN
jgi:beta-xylosidase